MKARNTPHYFRQKCKIESFIFVSFLTIKYCSDYYIFPYTIAKIIFFTYVKNSIVRHLEQ